MSKICDVCGLPEELCVCEEIAREVQTVKVFTVRRRFGKLMTIIEGIDEHDIDIKELTKTLKAKCACGGTSKNGQIELQGDHKVRVKEVLSDMGFSSDTIDSTFTLGSRLPPKSTPLYTCLCPFWLP